MQRRPNDGVVDGPAYGDHTYDDNATRSTGLLTRFVPHGLRNSAIYRLILRATRVLQFLSSVISLGLFSRRLAKVRNLVNTIKARRGVNSSFGAVEGILAAAVLYTLIAMIMSLIKKNSSPGGRMLRWLWVLLDVAFVGAFIAVAVLTRPNGGDAGPNHCYNPRTIVGDVLPGRLGGNNGDNTCDLPWGTFILAIISTILHAITAAFHEVREHRRTNRLAVEEEKIAASHGGVTGTGAHHDGVHNNGVGHGHTTGAPVTGTHAPGATTTAPGARY
jgi:hypothetical protein